MKQASKKAKGTKLEKWVASELARAGFQSRRQPGSGAFLDFPHDAVFQLGDDPYIIECKAWKHGWRTGERAMGKADLLVIKRDYARPAVYMTWDTFVRLIQTCPEEQINKTTYDDLGFPCRPWGRVKQESGE